jgi:NAD(P)-dependent dehydrogenase (short-subunit alcohol dehydrogenase family)
MRPRLKSIDEQVIVVTGASSGIGLAVARQAVAKGAAVVLAARNEPALQAIAGELAGSGGRVAVVAADVANETDVLRIADMAEDRFGGFDSWINNAAVGLYGSLEQVPLADHQRTFAVNYFGTVHGSLVAARRLTRRGGGAIVNVGSVLGDRAIVDQGPYAASKHAVHGFTEALRMELERDGAGISVSLIKPIGCGTPYAEHARNYMDKPPRIPQPLYDPTIIADAILFCCEHPRRTMHIGSGGVLASFGGRLAPRITDKAIEVTGRLIQQSPGDDGDPAMCDNLYVARRDGEVRDTRGLRMRKTSVVVNAQRLPRPSPVVTLAGAACALVLARMLATRRAVGRP